MTSTKIAVAAAMIASTQAATTEGSFAGPGFVSFTTKIEEEKGSYAGHVETRLGAKDVAFADTADFEAGSVWCLPTGSTDEFYCTMSTIVDPLGAKTLTLKVWKSTATVTFTEDESLATTLGTPDCTATYTDNTVGGDAICYINSEFFVSIGNGEDSFVDATSFNIPMIYVDRTVTADT